MGTARLIVVLAGAACIVSGCSAQARISLFDDAIVDDAGVARPSEPGSAPDGGAAGRSDGGRDPDVPWSPVGQGEGGTQSPPLGDDDASVPTDEGEVAATGSALALRYDFEGAGATILDRVGEAHAVALGGALLDEHGGLPLDGVDDYVDMPNGVLSSRRSVTIMAWLHWAGGSCWQRIFDFGSTDTGEGQVGRATTSLFLTPASCPEQVLLSMTEREADQQAVAAPRSLPTDRTAQVALVLDGEKGESALYIDGERQASAPNAHLMADLRDVNNWLGRSQWVQDGYLSARYDELRIYDGVLTDDEIAMLAERGADRP